MKRYAAHAAIAENWASWDRWMSFFIAAQWRQAATALSSVLLT
jgi:hypothetical protein